MNILVLNWRDTKHPGAGGAEILTHEIAKRWVKMGHSVVQLSCHFSGAPHAEIHDGVRIIRRGTWWTVHLWAGLLWFYRWRKWTDVVIDEVHWFPFFSAVYARNKTVLLACEVATPLFARLFPKPIALVGKLIEKLYLQLYRNVPTLAISPSTADALIAQGFNSDKITVLPMGVNIPRRQLKIVKNDPPVIVFLGRLHELKGVRDVIEAFSLIKQKYPMTKLWIIGTGSPQYVLRLKQLVKTLKIGNSVYFWERVSETRKFSLLAKAFCLVAPSFQEGWGLVVAEAASCGTPAIVYDVPGLRDVVQDGRTGIIVKSKTPQGLAGALISLLGDSKEYQKLSHNARMRVKDFDWGKTAKRSLEIITLVYENSRSKD